jgi:hypothetical protein
MHIRQAPSNPGGSQPAEQLTAIVLLASGRLTGLN